MKELIIYLLSISSFTLGGEHCHTIKEGVVERYTIAYTQSNDTIIRICDKSKTTKEIIIHELFHIYHFQLSEENKKLWTELYWRNKKKTGPLFRRGFVNLEATQNEYEMFAETGVYLLKKGKDNETTLLMKKFIGEHIFGHE